MFSLRVVIIVGIVCILIGFIFGFFMAAMCQAASHNDLSDQILD